MNQQKGGVEKHRFCLLKPGTALKFREVQGRLAKFATGGQISSELESPYYVIV